MARGRMLNKSVSASVKVHNLSDDTCRLMATWIIPHLDVRGVFYADPSMVKSTIFPRRADLTIEQVAGYLQELESVGLIWTFEANGDVWQCWPGFEHNQVGLRADRETSDFPTPPERGESGCRKDAGSLPDDCRKDAGSLPDDCRKDAGEHPAEEKLREDKVKGRECIGPREEQPATQDSLTIRQILAQKHTQAEWLIIIQAEKDRGEHCRTSLVAKIQAKLRAQEPALATYRRIFGRSPPAALCDGIVSAVGDKLEFWERVCTEWLKRGYNVRNVAGPLEWVAAGVIPKRSGGNGRASPATVREKPPAEDIDEETILAQRAAWKKWKEDNPERAAEKAQLAVERMEQVREHGRVM